MIYSSFDLEDSLWTKGYNLVCGIDEVGRGCFAGPAAVGAVIFPKNFKLDIKLADSKLLTPQKREKLDKDIKNMALDWSICEVSVININKFGIGKAIQDSFLEVLQKLKILPDFVLIDAFNIRGFDKSKQKGVKDGDKISASISAASIIAKVHRDKLMSKLHEDYPNYNFLKNKGYGTSEHRQAISKYGLSPLHRTSFDLNKFLKS